mgnify:FL=1
MRESKYPNGYAPKIAYYQAALSNAVDRLDMEKIKFFTGKLEYFMTREAQRVARLAQLLD